MVTEGDFEAAQTELVGSVSAKELEHYARVRAAFEGPEVQKQISASPFPELTKVPMPTKTKDKNSIPSGKAKAVFRPRKEANGKGKSSTWDSSEEDDDEAYITSNDFQNTPERGNRRSSAMGFGPGHVNDEEEMYE